MVKLTVIATALVVAFGAAHAQTPFLDIQRDTPAGGTQQRATQRAPKQQAPKYDLDAERSGAKG